MSGYLDSRKLTNVKGRINYITDKKRQENIVDYYNTTDEVFWKMLAKENRERHKEVKAGGINKADDEIVYVYDFKEKK